MSLRPRAWYVLTACVLLSGTAYAEAMKAMRFWNLTATTITELYVAAPGTGTWSSNLCLYDPDHTVDPDERLSFSGIPGGTYDVRVMDKDKRKCLFSSVTLHAQGPYGFAISEDQMKSCHGW